MGGEGTMVRIWCWYFCGRLWYYNWVHAWGRRKHGTYMVLIFLRKTVILQLSACLGDKEPWYVYGADIFAEDCDITIECLLGGRRNDGTYMELIFAEDCDITIECLLGGEGMMVRIWCWYFYRRLWYYNWVLAWGTRNHGTYIFAEDCDITIECLLGGQGMMVRIWCWYFCRRLWYYNWVLAWGTRNDGTYMVLIFLQKTVILQLSACLGDKEPWYVYFCRRLWYYNWVLAWGTRNHGTYMVLIFLQKTVILQLSACLGDKEPWYVYFCRRLWYYNWVLAWGTRNHGTYMVLIFLRKTVILQLSACLGDKEPWYVYGADIFTEDCDITIECLLGGEGMMVRIWCWYFCRRLWYYNWVLAWGRRNDGTYMVLIFLRKTVILQLSACLGEKEWWYVYGADIFAEDCDIMIECMLGGEGMMVRIWCWYICGRLWYNNWVHAWGRRNDGTYMVLIFLRKTVILQLSACLGEKEWWYVYGADIFAEDCDITIECLLGGEGMMVRIWCWYFCGRLWYNDWVHAWGTRNHGTYMVLIFLQKTVILRLSAYLGEKEWWYVYGADIFAEDCDITIECMLGGQGTMVRIWCWYFCRRLWYYDWVHAWGRRNDGTYMVLIFLRKTVILRLSACLGEKDPWYVHNVCRQLWLVLLYVKIN